MRRKPGAKRQASGEKDEAGLRAESAVTSAPQCGHNVNSPAVWSEATGFWREGRGRLARRVRRYKRASVWPQRKLSSGLERSDRIVVPTKKGRELRGPIF